MKPRHLIIRKLNRRNFLKTWGVAVGGLIYVPGKYLAQGQPSLTGAFKAVGAFSIGSTAASPINIITNGLFARWACNEGSGSTLYDSSGNGYNATFQNGAPTWVSGHSGGTAVQNTASNYAKTGNVSWITNDGAASTMCAWVYPTSFAGSGSGGIAICNYGQYADTNYDACLGVNTSGYACFFTDGNTSGTGSQASPYHLTLNAWAFIGWTQAGSGASVIFYNNGNSDVTSQAFDYPVISPQPLLVGCTAQDTAIQGYWLGAFQDVRVYNRALSATEMLSIYNGTG
jgi:hypothetical protein